MTMLAYCCNGGFNEGKKVIEKTQSEIANKILVPEFHEKIVHLADRIVDNESMYVIGRGQNYPIAQESAIKLQEVSYIHAEAFAGGELKHGPIALISKGIPCIALCAADETFDDIISNATEIKARGGFIIGISPKNNPIFDIWLETPECGIAQGIANLIPVQLLAYELGVKRGNDVDRPRNLAKSVTVF
jgi:glucosamine--fructose-6-phosphate aminotransferase (isomerizing)